MDYCQLFFQSGGFSNPANLGLFLRCVMQQAQAKIAEYEQLTQAARQKASQGIPLTLADIAALEKAKKGASGVGAAAILVAILFFAMMHVLITQAPACMQAAQALLDEWKCAALFMYGKNQLGTPAEVLCNQTGNINGNTIYTIDVKYKVLLGQNLDNQQSGWVVAVKNQTSDALMNQLRVHPCWPAILDKDPGLKLLFDGYSVPQQFPEPGKPPLVWDIPGLGSPKVAGLQGGPAIWDAKAFHVYQWLPPTITGAPMPLPAVGCAVANDTQRFCNAIASLTFADLGSGGSPGAVITCSSSQTLQATNCGLKS